MTLSELIAILVAIQNADQDNGNLEVKWEGKIPIGGAMTTINGLDDKIIDLYGGVD